MRRSWKRTLGAAVAALWLGAVSVEPAMLHACPTHGARAPTAAGAGHHQAMTHASQDAQSPHSTARHRCSCLGHCCVATQLALAAPAAPVPGEVALITSGRPSVVELRRDSPPYLLPFAQGPPLA